MTPIVKLIKGLPMSSLELDKAGAALAVRRCSTTDQFAHVRDDRWYRHRLEQALALNGLLDLVRS